MDSFMARQGSVLMRGSLVICAFLVGACTSGSAAAPPVGATGA